jgi:very-short-patch-repair endonuclease
MDAKGARADVRIAGIAARQHGVVSIAQLHAACISRNALRRRVEAGRLHRLHQGVYSVGHLGISVHGKWMAAVLACRGVSEVTDGDGISMQTVLDHWGAALSHRGAAALWGPLTPVDGPIDISIPGNGGRRRRKGIRLHRSLTLLPAVVTLRSGIPVTTPARTIEDLRRASAGSAPLVTPRELRRAIRQANFLGLPVGEEERRERNRSDLEGDFQGLCREHGLPAPEVNVRVGPHLVDFLWRDRNLVVETDGYISHRGRVAFEDDRGRDLDLRARGFEVIRLAEKQVNDEPHRVAEVVGAALRVGADAAQPA